MKCLRLFILLITAVLAGCATNSSHNTAAWQKHTYSAAETSRTVDLTNPPRDMWDRIRRGFAIPNLDNALTQQWTDYYAAHPESIQRMSERASKYLYYVVQEINRRGLPTELALLPFVESAYNPTAYSRAKASGLWQFIPSTGLHYNLQQDWWHDQRRDPVASTNAALDYLSYLYELQGDWYLALASYNWGEGSVQRAVTKTISTGDQADYTSINMPDETRNYVPKLQAIKNIIANPKKYGITLPHISNTPYFTTVQKSRDMDITVAAKLAEMSVEDFKSLNASFNRPIILGEHHPTLLLPVNRVDIFNANLEAYKGRLTSWQTYSAKRGETYASIAKHHGMSLGQLRAVNSLSGTQARAVAQTLLVPTTEAGSGAGIQLASFEPPQQNDEPTARAIRTTYDNRHRGIVTTRHKINVRTHTVTQGETLYSLAKRYKTSVQELRRLNNLKSTALGRGKTLRVPGTNVRG